MIKLIFLILILTSSITFANERLLGYQALEQKDYKTALYYLSYDANLGDDKAQYNLGIMYKKVLGVPVDENKAFSCFVLSANQGNILGNYALGQAYFKGSGINKNYKLELKSFKYSALRDHPTSRLIVGNMYFKGKGVEVSYYKAFSWWRLAEDLNIDGAGQNINMIKKKMTKEQYILGDKLYSECMKDTLYHCAKNFGVFN